MSCDNPGPLKIPGTVVVSECNQETTAECSASAESCRNPLYAFDHPTECGWLGISRIELVPPNQTVIKGRAGVVTVNVKFSDGRVANVTDESTIGSSQQTVARYAGGGLVEGVSAGTSALVASWKGRTATGQIKVVEAACVDTRPIDLVLVMDDLAVLLGQQIRLITGEIVQVPFKRIPSSENDLPWGAWAFLESMDLIDVSIPNGNRTGNDRLWDGFQWVNTFTKSAMIGAIAQQPSGFTGYSGADAASRILAATSIVLTGRPTARKAILLVSTGSDGADAFACTQTGGILGAAAVARANGVELFVVTPLSPSDEAYSFCNFPMKSYDVLAQAATTDCHFFPAGGGGSPRSVGEMLLDSCTGLCSSGSGVGLYLL
jgi:hypothetical protein